MSDESAERHIADLEAQLKAAKNAVSLLKEELTKTVKALELSNTQVSTLKTRVDLLEKEVLEIHCEYSMGVEKVFDCRDTKKLGHLLR